MKSGSRKSGGNGVLMMPFVKELVEEGQVHNPMQIVGNGVFVEKEKDETGKEIRPTVVGDVEIE